MLPTLPDHPLSSLVDASSSDLRPPLLGGVGPAASPTSTLLAPAFEDGLPFLLLSGTVMVLGWLVMFYALSAWWAHFGKMPVSSKPHENDPFWCARNIIGIWHAVIVGGISVVAAVMLLNASAEDQFAYSNHIGTCRKETQLLSVHNFPEIVAFAGLLFVTFTIADVFISLAHGMAGIDFIIHHFAFITAGVIIRRHCMLPLNAAILLAMEVSTPFLNWVFLVRHRPGYQKSNLMCMGLFLATFIFFRALLNTYGAVVLWAFRSRAMPPQVTPAEVWFLVIAVSVGAAVQMYWLGHILSMARKFLQPTEGAGKADLA